MNNVLNQNNSNNNNTSGIGGTDGENSDPNNNVGTAVRRLSMQMKMMEDMSDQVLQPFFSSISVCNEDYLLPIH